MPWNSLFCWPRVWMVWLASLGLGWRTETMATMSRSPAAIAVPTATASAQTEARPT